MFGKYNGFVSNVRVSACMYFLVKNTKAIYFTNTLNDCENNPKKMWKTINKLINKQSKQLLYPKSLIFNL